MILGKSKKGLDDLAPFCAAELDELINGMEEVAKSGTPEAVPAAVAVGHLARMAATLKQYRAVALKLTEIDVFSFMAEPELTEGLEKLQAEANALLNIEPPKRTRIVQPGQV